MTLYSLFDRPGAGADAITVVPEKFSLLAALLPPVFGLLHGLWLELIAFVAAVALIAMLSLWVGAGAGLLLYLMLALLIGFEAPALRRGALRRRGWRLQAERYAVSAELAQVEWLAGRLQ